MLFEIFFSFFSYRYCNIYRRIACIVIYWYRGKNIVMYVSGRRAVGSLLQQLSRNNALFWFLFTVLPFSFLNFSYFP